VAVIIEFEGVRATIDGLEWVCEADRDLEAVLNALLPEGGPDVHDPHPDLSAATMACNWLGAAIVNADPPPAEPSAEYCAEVFAMLDRMRDTPEGAA